MIGCHAFAPGRRHAYPLPRESMPNTLPIIDEYSWGLELRHRFGQHQDKYFFVDVTRDLQNWGSPEIPYVSGASFQGTAIKLGWIW